MTFTIAARCPETGQAGLALATVSLAAGGLAPFYTPTGDIVASQAYASPKDGFAIVNGLIGGAGAAEALAAARASDPHVAYRQFLILARNGDTIAWTGESCRPWAGDIVEEDLIVAGNVLAGPHVITAMRDAYWAAAGASLGSRLVSALEAGRDAGGQATADGTGMSERSASVRVLGTGEEAGLAILDLRVDMHPSAVHELRRLHDIYAVYEPYSLVRDTDPPNSPSMVAYEAGKLKDGGVFAERPSCFR